MATRTNPFDVAGEAGESDGGNEPVSIADAASSALSDIEKEDGAAQATLEGTDYTKVKFVGVQFDSLESNPKIGDEMEFRVRGRVVGVGDEAMNDGHVRHFAKVKVSSVALLDEEGNPVEIGRDED